MAHVPTAERRPQLVRAAIDLMTRKGIAAGSTRAIAAELGVAQATVHYTFGTKEGLYRAVMDQLIRDLVAQVERAVPDGAGFEETISTLAIALWQTVREQPQSYQLLNELTLSALRSPDQSEDLGNHVGEVTRVTASLVAEAAERAGQTLAHPAETVARFFLAGFDGLTAQRLSRPDDEAEWVCLQALISASMALASGQLNLVALPAQPSATATGE